jgi:hypothetical protein
MGLPPTINLLTDTLPILRSDRLPADEFAATGIAPVDAATIDAVRDLFKNRRRVSLFDILGFLVITLCNPEHPGHLTCRITYRMGKENVLVFSELELFGRVTSVTIVEMSGKALRGGEKIHVRGDKTRGDVII